MRHYLFAAAAALLAAMPAQAVIVSGTLTGGNVVTSGGVFQVTSLPHLEVNTINSKNILGINERQSFTLTSGLRVFNIDVAAGVTPDNTVLANTANTTVIAAGTRVHSHMIILDPTASGPGAGGTTASGTVTFQSKILGYIFTNTGRLGANFTNTNFLGAPGTTYGALHATLEGGTDAVSFSGNTLTFAMTSGRDVGDYLRVITAVLEPKSWAMMLAGFGLVGFGMRRRRTAAVAA